MMDASQLLAAGASTYAAMMMALQMHFRPGLGGTPARKHRRMKLPSRTIRNAMRRARQAAR